MTKYKRHANLRRNWYQVSRRVTHHTERDRFDKPRWLDREEVKPLNVALWSLQGKTAPRFHTHEEAEAHLDRLVERGLDRKWYSVSEMAAIFL